MTDAPVPTIKVLLVEDDTRLAQLTARYLESHGVVVTVVHDGIEGQAEALGRQYDCIVLDLVPILMVTARAEESDRVLGLEVGADDCVTKPFSPRELLARICATVRRVRGQAGPQQQTTQVGELVLDPQRMTPTPRRPTSFARSRRSGVPMAVEPARPAESGAAWPSRGGSLASTAAMSPWPRFRVRAPPRDSRCPS